MLTRRILIAVILFAALFVLAVPRPAEGSSSVSVSFFHEQLSPHGRWVVAGSYGDCWVPGSVAAGWSPYVDGEWIWTDYGWTWASYDPWGDIPYHYGTWVWVDPYGWVWVPGTIWAPAWVTWAYTDDYIGWAPVPPSFVLSATGYFGRPIVVSERYYCFVPTRQFVGVNVSTVRVPLQQNATIFTQATKTTHYTVSSGVVRVAGPPASQIERVIGRRIERVGIDRAKTKPTTLSAGGVAKARSLHVVAPAPERARAIHAVAKEGGKRPEAQAKPQRAAVEKPKPAKPEKSASATAPKHERVVAAPKKYEPPPPKVARKEESKPKPKPEHTTAATRSRPETRREASPQVKSAEKPRHEKPLAQSERHEETSVAAGTGHHASAGSTTRHEQAPPKHEQPKPAVAPPSAPAQSPSGQVKRERHAPPSSPPGQAKEKKKEKEKE